MRRKIALYSPYIPKHSGGGEKYLLSIGEIVSLEHDVDLLVPDDKKELACKRIQEYSKLFHLDLSRIHVRACSIGKDRSPLKTAFFTREYNVLFAITDGSFFPTFSSKAYLIVQVPWTRALTTSEKLKLHTWKQVLVYSSFVKTILQHSWQSKKITVLSPYVDTEEFSPAKKENVILNVGRFFQHSQSNSKRQDVIIEAFKKLYDSGALLGYTLVLIGNVDPNPDSEGFLNDLRQKAHLYPIQIITDSSYVQMKNYYSRARMYWHAAGFEINQEVHPENTEHFGITTLESMASGCVPFVVPKGGQKEIVTGAGYFWESTDELSKEVTGFLQAPAEKQAYLAHAAIERSYLYKKETFIQKVKELL